MESLLGLASTQPLRALASGEVLIDQGSTGGDLFIVESGRLAVERDGVKILTGDVADLLENFERERIGGAMDDEAALASIRRLNAIARETGGELIPLHDPLFVQRARLAPDYYA